MTTMTRELPNDAEVASAESALDDLATPEQDSAVEFVDRAKAEAEAARAIGLLNASDEAKVEAWFAMQAVADQVGPASNVGVRGISWKREVHQNRYSLCASCVNGPFKGHTGAPTTLEDARRPEHLDRAVALLERKITEMGGRHKTLRAKGTGRALVESVATSPSGQKWLAKRSAPRAAQTALLIMVRVADAYGRDGVNPAASLRAHHAFITFDERVALVREYPDTDSARAKVMSLRRGIDEVPKHVRVDVSPTCVAKLALRTGLDLKSARAVLRLTANYPGRKLLRAIKEAEQMNAARESKAA